MSTTDIIRNEPVQAIRRREKAAAQLHELFAQAGLQVSRASHYRGEALDHWGWSAITEDILELIDRGKLA